MQTKKNNPSDLLFIMNENIEEEDPELAPFWKSDSINSPNISTRPKSRAQLTPGPILEDEITSTHHNGYRISKNQNPGDGFMPTPVKGDNDKSKRRHLTPGHHSVSSMSSNTSTPTNTTRASPNNFMRYGLTLDATKKKTHSPPLRISTKTPRSPPSCLFKTSVTSPRFSPSINMLDPASDEYVPNAFRMSNKGTMRMKPVPISEGSFSIDSPKLPSFYQPPAANSYGTYQQPSKKEKGIPSNHNVLSMKSMSELNARPNGTMNDPSHELNPYRRSVPSGLSYQLTDDGEYDQKQNHELIPIQILPPSGDWHHQQHRYQQQPQAPCLHPSYQDVIISRHYNYSQSYENKMQPYSNQTELRDSDYYQYSSSYPPSPQVHAKHRNLNSTDMHDHHVVQVNKKGVNIPKPMKGSKQLSFENSEKVSSSTIQTKNSKQPKIKHVEKEIKEKVKQPEAMKTRETLVETPLSKIAFKDFCREVRNLEKDGGGYEAAYKFAWQCISEELIPHKIHWKVCLELAERARRENMWQKASQLYSAACEMQPFAAAGWIDWAKLEEERGRLKASCEVLKLGLLFCDLNESLITRRIKLEEKLYNHYNSKTLFHKLLIPYSVHRNEVDTCGEEGDLKEVTDTLINCSISLGGEHSDDIECALINQFKERLFDGKDTFGVFADIQPSKYHEVHRSLTNIFDDQFEEENVEAGDISSASCTVLSHTESNRLESIRRLLGKLQGEPIEKIWRAVLEGALLEARNGEMNRARVILTFLIEQVPWYGPVHYEYFRIEERNENLKEAMSIMLHGLNEVPRYGPLWFGKLRVTEVIDVVEWKQELHRWRQKRQDIQCENQSFPLPSLPRTREAIEQAKDSITKELIWKVHFEAAAIEERTAMLICKEMLQEIRYEKQVREARRKVLKQLIQLRDHIHHHCEEEHINEGSLHIIPCEQNQATSQSTCTEGQPVDGLSLARSALALSAQSAPENLRWKVWLAGGRMELCSPDLMAVYLGYDVEEPDHEWIQEEYPKRKVDAINKARLLLKEAYMCVPDKSKAQVMLECARLEEYANPQCPKEARHILQKACQEARHEWKVFLEAVMLEIRAMNWLAASEAAIEALKVHSGTGRLWAALIQLKGKWETWTEDTVQEAEVFYAEHGLPNLSVLAPQAIPLKEDNYVWDFSWAQHFTLKQALNEVPKSGEVWCESGRLHLNPLNRFFDVTLAHRHLEFAVNFTPQYGDSFIEQVRLILLVQNLLPLSKDLIASRCDEIDQIIQSHFRGLNEDDLLPAHKQADDISFIMKLCQELGIFSSQTILLSHSTIRTALDSCHFMKDDGSNFEQLMARLELVCTNADPNYGVMWFHCRDRPGDSPKGILKKAKEWILQELEVQSPIYLQAMCRRLITEYALRAVGQQLKQTSGHLTCTQLFEDNNMQWDRVLETALRTAAPVEPLALAMSTLPNDYNTGFVKLNRIASDIENLSDELRRKFLFGSDQILP